MTDPAPRHELGAHAQSILQWAPDAVICIDQSGSILAWNPMAERIFGWTREEAVGRLLSDTIVPPSERARHAAGLARYDGLDDSGARTRRFETTGLHKDGFLVPLELTIIPEPTPDGWIFTAFLRDLSERRRLDAALRESEERFRMAFQHAGIGMMLTDMDGRFIQVNRAFADMLGYSEPELTGKRFNDVTHPGDFQVGLDAIARQRSGEVATVNIEKRYVHRDGRTVWVELWATVVRDDRGVPLHVIAQVEDITRRHVAEEALRASEESYRVMFEESPSPKLVYEAATLGLLAVNSAAVRLYGFTREEFRRMTIRDIRPPEDVAKLEANLRAIGARTPFRGELTHRRKNGTDFLVEVATHPVTFEGREAVLVLVQDLSEKRARDEQMAQAARMEAVGRLAGGVAHDLNNMLTIIQGYGQLLAKKLARGEAPGTEMEEVRYATQRANSLTQQLLAFSRRQVLRPKVLDLNAAVEAMEPLLRRAVGEHIEVAISLDPAAGRVKADPGQLDQVVLNLALNARDAMPEGGRLRIATGREAGPQAGWATLEVADTGTGIAPDVLPHIFEPFFTTKQGRGTGLGLATVYGIVHQSGGQIRVASEPGRGASFVIRLPATPETPPADGPDASAHPPRGAETVLVAEDEPHVRTLAVRILRLYGYTVLEAADPADALRIAESDPRPIHLLFTDVIMPRIPGPELARRFRIARPAGRVLFTSGYLDQAAGSLPDGAHILAKPFTDDLLARRVRDVLDAPAGGNA
ncbi:MAG: PAS domain S-box protein [Planctomycetia bacterium]|nr:PAS domain S-box protein [Planctomycetia bacterium]